MRLLYPFSLVHSRRPSSLSSAIYSTGFKPPLLLYCRFEHTQEERIALQIHTSEPNHDADPLHYLQHIITLVNTLTKNPRNFNALSTLDSLLSQTQFFNCSTSLIVIDYLSQIKKLGRAKSVLLNLKSRSKVSDYFLYSSVIDCLVDNGKIDDVETVWREICGSQATIDISDYVIYVCKFGGVCEIKSICQRILKGRRILGTQSYIALIGALCRENESLLAKLVVKEMNDQGLKLDALVCYSMFQCFCRNGDLDEADLILRKLVKRKFRVDICVYSNFMYALCKSGKFREASKLLRKLIKKDCMGGYKKDDFLKEGRRAIFQLNCEGNIPEIMAYETYFRSLCDFGRLDEAEILLKKMMKSRTLPEICVYGSFIKALFLADREKDAIKFFNVERKKGLIEVDELARYIIVGLCEKGKLDEAVRIFDEIVEIGGFVDCVNVCNCMLSSYWKEGRVAEAENLFGRLRSGKHGQPNVFTCKIMVHGYCNQGNISEALGLFDEMQNRKIGVNGIIYEIIISDLCTRGRLKEALKYLNDMIENGCLVSFKRWKAFLSQHFLCLNVVSPLEGSTG